jgi:8-oxo-dGTP pyrophosphatase MutT (NUDIX family)
VRIIKIFDDKDYEAHWKKYKRDSARAIIFSDDKLVMIKSDKYGECKFPGGGIDCNETHIDAIIRETKEETGLHILPDSVREYGRTLILRKGINDNEIFEQESFYYLCDIDKETYSLPKLDVGYETEYGYKLVYVSLNEGININEKLLNMKEIPWVQRDLTVLYELRELCTE